MALSVLGLGAGERRGSRPSLLLSREQAGFRIVLYISEATYAFGWISVTF